MSLYNENYVLYDFTYVLCDTQERERSNAAQAPQREGALRPRILTRAQSPRMLRREGDREK